jgi:4-hydroxybenzoate polyprenyltransferase
MSNAARAVLEPNGTTRRAEVPAAALPLVIDAERALLRADLSGERVAARLAGRALRPDLLPVRDELAAFAAAERESGRPVHLVTDAPREVAEALAARFEFVDEVLWHDGRGKAARLAERFPHGFAYAGDPAAEAAVWALAGAAVPVGPGAGARGETLARFARERAGLKVWARALRLHQWAKNALVFVALMLGGRALDLAAWEAAGLMFLALGVLASSTYLVNDLVDLADDRRHWSKRERPLASGRLPVRLALAAVPAGVALAFALAWLAGGLAGTAFAGAYLGVTLAYSLRLKREPILDVAVLAALFTLRIAAGVAVTGVAWSAWLLAFSMLLFLSLSLAKRHTEAVRMLRHGTTAARGYVAADAPILLALGVASATASIVLLVLYLIEEAFKAGFYAAPQALWALPVVLFLWLGRIWLLCGRGQLHDDPVSFALRDRASLGHGVLVAAAVGVAILL